MTVGWNIESEVRCSGLCELVVEVGQKCCAAFEECTSLSVDCTDADGVELERQNVGGIAEWAAAYSWIARGYCEQALALTRRHGQLLP